MSEVDYARLKVALGQHYAAQRENASAQTKDALVAAMVAEDARMRRTQQANTSLATFVAAQVRFIPAWTWAAQAALVALMCLVAFTVEVVGVAKIAIGMLSAATVLVGVPTMASSKHHGVAELEYACPHNAASVMVARLVVLGAASALAVAVMVVATAATLDTSAFDVGLWACPPYFFSCAGVLALLRKVSPSVAITMSAVWVAACTAVLLAVATLFPDVYNSASLAVWAGAAALAFVWLVRELAMTFRAVAAGLDAFSPARERY